MILGLIEEACAAGSRLEPACEAISLDPRTIQRWRERRDAGRPLDDERLGPRTVPANALTPAEEDRVLATVNSPEFRDLPPTRIVPLLADRGIYIASESTIYRILRRRSQLAHRGTSRPRTRRRPRELEATRPGEVWSWDITYIHGPVRGRFLYLYMVMDVWSRMIVAAELHTSENDEIAAEMMTAAAHRHGVKPKMLALHSDNGNPMRGSTMLATLQQLGVMASFSRPRCSNDNPFSESLFGTLKGRPDYPAGGRFDSDDAARAWVAHFVHWYNHIHQHSAIRFVTPAERHHGLEHEILDSRDAVYHAAREQRPDRWTGRTRNWTPIESVLLNPDPKRSKKKSTKPRRRRAASATAPPASPSPSRGRPGVRGRGRRGPR